MTELPEKLEVNTIYQGDCRKLIHLTKEHKPVGVITDFPYGVDFQSNQRTQSAKFEKIKNDAFPFVDKWIWESYKAITNPGFFLTFYRYDVQDVLFAEIERVGWNIKSQLVWPKGGGGMGDLKGTFSPDFEVAVFCTKGDWAFPDGRPAACLPSQKVSGYHIVHPNEKPIALCQHLVRVLTKKGDLIIDPFSGSGAISAGAVSEGRLAIGFELDDRKVERIGNINYIEYGNKRIQDALKMSNKLF